jgi:amino acid permease
MDINKELEKIHERNKKVEADKAWETSHFRMLMILIFTYVVAYFFMLIADMERPYLGAFVPVLGFFLSTLSLPWLKKWWIKKFWK